MTYTINMCSVINISWVYLYQLGTINTLLILPRPFEISFENRYLLTYKYFDKTGMLT